jgi:Family of unknown function (DUF695)
MWPTFLKKPLDPKKLPVADKWQVSKGERAGKPMILRAHAGYRDFCGVTGYDHQVDIAVPLHGADAHGLPRADENEELNAIEDTICKLLEPQNESLFVATITCGGIREFVLYTSNPDAVKRKFKLLQDLTFSHRIHLRIQPDKDWNVYAKLL